VRKIIFAIIATGLSVLPARANAQVGTTQDMYDRCVRDDPLCASYLMGVASVMSLFGKAYQNDPRFEVALSIFAVCPNGAPTNGRILTHVFMAWVDRHPESKRNFMESSAMDALTRLGRAKIQISNRYSKPRNVPLLTSPY
jgi:hypothetical protein